VLRHHIWVKSVEFDRMSVPGFISAPYTPASAYRSQAAVSQAPTYQAPQRQCVQQLPQPTLSNDSVALSGNNKTTTPWNPFLLGFTKLPVSISPLESVWLTAIHPFRFFEIRQAEQKANRLSSLKDTVKTLKQYQSVYCVLDGKGRKDFETLWKAGVLNQKTENGESGLYHLYSMLTSPRSPGYNPSVLVREAVDIIANPYNITQRIAPLSDKGLAETLRVANAPSRLDASGKPAGRSQPLQPEELQISNSATCVASSVMFCMANNEPAELLRQFNELTSLNNGFTEQVSREELMPEQPDMAAAVLNGKQVAFTLKNPEQFTTFVPLPKTAKPRALDSQDITNIHKRQYRGVLETLYQSSLTALGNPTYNAARDLMADGSGGLTAEEKTVIETIIKDNHGTQSVTSQSVSSGGSSQDTSSYLYGYNRSFEQTTQDLVNALKMGQPVIIGITDTDETGRIINGHELTVTDAHVSPKNGKIIFTIADSDDGKQGSVHYEANQLIPKIHHMGLPLRLGQSVNQQIQQTVSPNAFLLPDATDAKIFRVPALASSNPSSTPIPTA
jgi:hypothetical protein